MNQRYIELEERDEDGYWIYLRRGYQDAENPDCHTILENTKREAHMHKLAACSCPACRALT